MTGSSASARAPPVNDDGRFQFGGPTSTVRSFLTEQAEPGPGAGTGGIAVRGLVSPSVRDQAVSPNDQTGRTFVSSLAPSGGAQVLLTTDGGTSFSTASTFGADRVAWWNGPDDHQWLLAEGRERLRPKPFTVAAGTGPLDMGEELAATVAHRDDHGPGGQPFLVPDSAARFGGAELTYRLTIVSGGQQGSLFGLPLRLSDIPPGGVDITVPTSLVQLLNGQNGRAVGWVNSLDLPPAPRDVEAVPLGRARTLATGSAVSTTVPLAVGSGTGAFSAQAQQSAGPRTARLTAPTSGVTLASSARVSWAVNGLTRTYQVQRAVKAIGRALGAWAAWASVPGSMTSKTTTGLAPGRARAGGCARCRASSSVRGRQRGASPCRSTSVPSSEEERGPP